MKCAKNKCKHYIDDVYCEVFKEVSAEMRCYGAFELRKNGDD